MLMDLRFEPSRFFFKGRKNLLGSKRKAINIYFEPICYLYSTAFV